MIAFGQWMENTPTLMLGVLLLLAMCLAAFIGYFGRRYRERRRTGDKDEGSQEGYVVSAVLGLLALLLGFTFALAVDRFETRRSLVLQEANAIGTSYLRSQLLEDPHRSRMSGILLAYTENRVALGTAKPANTKSLLERNDRLLTDLWSATAAAFDSVSNKHFSSSLLDTVNEVIDLDASRKAARQVRVPAEVFVVLVIYVVVTAGVLGYVLIGSRGIVVAGFLFILMVMSLLLIMDIDRPALGGITEAQGPMIELRDALRKQPPGTFDRWR
ncbi:hypothetical protein [Sphingomonas cavernae]|uniref:DUF4239 domain-containing protein n=1 Tax=Sphingomonas cavernae TaxID=2320861 RepID=A0A418WUN2_9SPHN|nr:hypothetical protein [Sphingomonas cavernae]RJF96413.1 hypothetical protein D3876_00050 [Sphingomonas cavernae]